MAKIILGNESVSMSESPIVIDAPKYEKPEEEVKRRGPTKEEVEEKIEDIKSEFEHYKQKSLIEFEEWKKEQITKYENEAFDIVKKSVEDAETKFAEANIKYNSKIKEAQEEAEKIKNKAMDETDIIQDNAAKDGYNKGKEEGFEAGNKWAKSAIKKLNIILSTVAREQTNLVRDAKEQIAEIVIVMARKIINTMVETQSRVVYDNIISVLKNLKGRAEIIIRVNGEDLAQTTKHKREFLQMIEGIERIKITEDNTVDKGGCIIETEYGDIDSRITTQLSKIEKLVRNMLESERIGIIEEEPEI